MPRILIGCLALVLFLPAHADDDFISPSEPNGGARFSEETRRAFDLESKADFVAWYSTDGKLDIGVGRADKERNIHYPIRFALDELEGFFDDQRHKGLIVVTVAKHVWADDELNEHLERLRDYFIARGYERIVIEQAYASGRGIHLEHPKPKPAEQGGAGEPATRTESDSEGGDKPQPESKERSQ
ncbi:hypothetical protein [Haloferula sp.]|uniref:hypothetical protein n=1 Tax=Haloferula sp. TaxID=2497595 RepID=UPI00329AA59C